MDLTEKNVGVWIPVKSPKFNRSKTSQNSNSMENRNPNVSSPPPVKSANNLPYKSPSPKIIASPKNKICKRRFVVAKKSSKNGNLSSSTSTCKCLNKCLCRSYEILRASQEDFFKKKLDVVIKEEAEKRAKVEEVPSHENGNKCAANDDEVEEDYLPIYESDNDPEEMVSKNEMGSSTIKRRREKVMEDARKSMPELGSGNVKHLVKAFEKYHSLAPPKKTDREESSKVTKWALPGLQQPAVQESQESLSSFFPSDLVLTFENLGLDSRATSSWDSTQASNSSRTSGGGRRSRRISIESCGIMGGSKWKKKQLRVTSQKPFKLRTEQRGRLKEEELMKKIQKMMLEQERLRIPVAQGLPWTTDEPECLVKPPVKDITRPIDLMLHSDLRAMDRAEFDNQVAEKLSLIEQYKMERERQQKLAQEEETRRLRRELIPKAQPMPYFDRPFIPRRSMRHPTVPKEPKFHTPHHKKIKCSSSSSNEISPYTY